MKKLIQYLSCFIPFFAAEAIKIVLAMLFTIIFMIFLIIGKAVDVGKGDKLQIGEWITEMENVLANSGNMMYIISMLAIMGCGIIFYFWNRRLKQREDRFDFKTLYTRKKIITLIILGIGAQLFVTGILGMIEPFFQEAFTDYADNMEGLLGANIVLVLLFVIVIAPVVEELIFRGVIMHKLNKQVSFIGANLLQAALFGIYHYNLVQGLYAFLLGLVLGFVGKKYRTLSAPIILHVIINGVAFMVGVFGSSIWSYLGLFLSGSIFVGFSIYHIHKSESIS